MANIDDFKANLIGGGARANQFRVTITPPPGIAIVLDVRRASFLVTASNLPGSTLGEIPVPFRGRNIYVAGDRPAPEPWSSEHVAAWCQRSWGVQQDRGRWRSEGVGGGPCCAYE